MGLGLYRYGSHYLCKMRLGLALQLIHRPLSVQDEAESSITVLVLIHGPLSVQYEAESSITVDTWTIICAR